MELRADLWIFWVLGVLLTSIAAAHRTVAENHQNWPNFTQVGQSQRGPLESISSHFHLTLIPVFFPPTNTLC